MKGFRKGTGAVFALALTLAGQGATAQAADPAAVAALSRAIAEAGCSVTAQNQQAVAAAAGLQNPEVAAAARHLFETGQATLLERATLRLLTGDCATDAPVAEAPALLVAVIEVLRGNACSLTQRQGDALLTPLGDRTTVREHLGRLRDSGLARVTEDARRVFLLSEPLCTADAGQMRVLAANVAGVAALGGEDFAPSRLGVAHVLVGAIRDQGCSVPLAETTAILGATGIEQPETLLGALSGAGIVTFAEGRADLAKPACKIAEDGPPALLSGLVLGMGAMTVRRATSVMIGALALGLPGAAGALDTLEAEIARAAAFVEVVRANGCAITEAEAERPLPPAGLTMDDAQGAALLLNRGALFTVSEDGEALILTPELCAAEAEAAAALIAAAAQAGPRVQFLELGQRIDPAAGARLVGALRANGCAMTEDRAGAILPGLGFDPETVQDLAALLIQTGFARYDGALHLDPAACAADAGQDHDLIFTALGRLADLAGLPPATPDLTGVRAAVGLAAMRQGCVIDLEDLAATRAVLTYEVLMHYDIAEPSDEVLATIAAHIDTTLAEPGPAYAREPGRLRLTSCMP